MVQHGATVHELKDLWVCGSRLRLEIDVPQRIPGADGGGPHQLDFK